MINLREDIRVFSGKQPGGFFKFLYFPDVRVVILYRLSRWFYLHKLSPLAYLLTNINDLLHGVWIGPKVDAGVGLSLGHPRGVVINPGSKIGKYCTIINQVTIGGPEVIIEDFVEVGAGAKIISKKGKPVIIGRHSIIGAGAVVVKSVPPYSICAGVPAKVIANKDLNEWMKEHPYYSSVIEE